jgi:hypothetical protein
MTEIKKDLFIPVFFHEDPIGHAAWVEVDGDIRRKDVATDAAAFAGILKKFRATICLMQCGNCDGMW